MMIRHWKIARLEIKADELLQKIERIKKRNEKRCRVGREGMHDQIENHIRIAQNQRQEILKEIEEEKKMEIKEKENGNK